MKIYFDLDYTLLSYNGHLRPGTMKLLERLKKEGHIVHIWSGAGYRQDDVSALGLDPLVEGVHLKPIDDFNQVPTSERPDFVVDDYPEIVEYFGGVLVRPYFWPNGEDRELDRVYQCIQDAVRDHDHRQPKS
jgi:hypothetical protein